MKDREIAKLICEIIDKLPLELQEFYIDKWNALLDKYERWNNV